MKTTLAHLAEAMETAKGRTPAEVLDAFLPEGATVAGLRLVPLTAGHDLFLARIGHPLATGEKKWDGSQVGMALFAFSRPSAELFAMVENDTLDQAYYTFLDTLPIGAIENAAALLIGHWIRARATMVPMLAPDGPGGGSKKKRASGGSSR
jgi:hypothetical protein